jgi:GNAT superfamily N-acetyltransferase
MTLQRELVIRDARESERDAIRDLTQRVYAEYATVMAPDSWAGLAAAVESALASTDPMERIVAVDEGSLIGSVLLFPPSARAYGDLTGAANNPEFRLLAVAPEARGRGIGRALVDECVRRARRSGATALGLHTSRSMVAAIELYRQMGFVRAPELDFQPAGSELVEGYQFEL